MTTSVVGRFAIDGFAFANGSQPTSWDRVCGARIPSVHVFVESQSQ
jgi:hypothetical protein